MLGGFCTLLGSRMLYPVTLVLAPWRYVISSASTQLRFRLYSQDARRRTGKAAHPLEETSAQWEGRQHNIDVFHSKGLMQAA